MREDRLRLVDDQNQPIYHQEQIVEAVDKHEADQAQVCQKGQDNDDFEEDELYDFDNDDEAAVKDMKPSVAGTKLEMKEFDMQMLEREVLDHVRRNTSKFKENEGEQIE